MVIPLLANQDLTPMLGRHKPQSLLSHTMASLQARGRLPLPISVATITRSLAEKCIALFTLQLLT